MSFWFLGEGIVDVILFAPMDCLSFVFIVTLEVWRLVSRPSSDCFCVVINFMYSISDSKAAVPCLFSKMKNNTSY